MNNRRRTMKLDSIKQQKWRPACFSLRKILNVHPVHLRFFGGPKHRSSLIFIASKSNFIVWCLYLFSLLTNNAHAADLPAPNPLTEDVLNTAIFGVRDWLLSISMIIAVIMLAYGGIMWMLAGGDTKNIEKAKGIVKSAIIGAAVVLAVWVIIETVRNIINNKFF